MLKCLILNFVGNRSCCIPLLMNSELRGQFDRYINTGNYLREEVEYISDNIRVEMMRVTSNPRLFYYLWAGCGLGKSQLAASLSLPVVYIPLAGR